MPENKEGIIDVAVLVVSHNNPKLTDSLCETIIKNTKRVSYDLFVIETGSDLDKCSKFMTLYSNEKCRMTSGWNLLKEQADTKGKYKAYHLFVNDAEFIGDEDMISQCFEDMVSLNDCGYIHPYQSVEQPACRLLNKQGNGIRKVSFAEIVCPMISAELWQKKPDFLDKRFFYGWGLDYDHPKLVHDAGFRMYITDKAGVKHIAFTSYRTGADKLKEQEFKHLAHKNMTDGLIDKYGLNWIEVIKDSIPADVSKEALNNWLVNA